MNSFLRGSAPPGASSSPNNLSVLQSRSHHPSPDASFIASSPSKPFECPTPLPVSQWQPQQPAAAATSRMTGDSADGPSTMSVAPLLTASLIRRFKRQMRLTKGRAVDGQSQQTGLATTSAGTGDPLELSGPGLQSSTLHTSTQERRKDTDIHYGNNDHDRCNGDGRMDDGEDDDDDDSEMQEMYTKRTERCVRAFLIDVAGEDYERNPLPVPDTVEGSRADHLRVLQERLWRLSAEELRALALDLEVELLDTLYDAVTLETSLTETDEDAAVLERALGQREEALEMLKAQLNTADDYTQELHDAKREALRKLSDAKTEMALLSQRNAKLLRELGMKEEELQMSFTSTANGAHRPPAAAAAERRDAATLTELLPREAEQREASAAAGAEEAAVSFSAHSRAATVRDELAETQDELRLARSTLCSAEMERIKLQEQLQELREASRLDHHRSSQHHHHRIRSHSQSDDVRLGREEEEEEAAERHRAELRRLEERCEAGERKAASLEAEVQRLQSELATAKAARDAAEAAAAVSPVQPALHVTSSSPSEPTTPAAKPASSPRLRSDRSGDRSGSSARGSHAEPPPAASTAAEGAERVSLSLPRSVSMEAQMAVLQRQLARAQADAARLEHDLRQEREKAQRYGQSEKKLLENVAHLTRQLRAREALDREARALRRSAMNTARAEGEGEDANASGSEPRRGRLLGQHSSREDVAASGGGAVPQQAPRAVSPEQRRRRESLFAALRDLHRSRDERRTAAPDATDTSIASSTHDTPLTESKEELKGPPQRPQQESQPSRTAVSRSREEKPSALSTPLPSKEEPRLSLAKAKPAATPPLTTPASSATATEKSQQLPTQSLEQPTTSASSFRVSRLSVASLLSPRHRRSGSYGTTAHDANGDDSVRVDAASQLQPPPQPAAAPTTPGPAEAERSGRAVNASSASHRQQPQPSVRDSLVKESTASFRLDDAAGGKKSEGRQQAQPQSAVPAPAVVAAVRPSAATEPIVYVLPESAHAHLQPPPHTVMRGQSSVRATSSGRPVGVRSSSVGATVHRNSLSLSFPTTVSAATNLSSTTPTQLSASMTPRGATIVRGLGATAPNTSIAPRKRAASRRMMGGRETKPINAREGSTSLLR